MDIEMNSCSTMHKITAKEFTLDDFSHEHLMPTSIDILRDTIDILNDAREAYIDYDTDKMSDVREHWSKKDIWWQMIQLLPNSYNQRRTIKMSYEVLANIYKSRKHHKLDEWCAHWPTLDDQDKGVKPTYVGLCDWIETLPYSELITGKEQQEKTQIKGLDGTTYTQDEDRQGWTGSSYSGRGEGLWQPGDKE